MKHIWTALVLIIFQTVCQTTAWAEWIKPRTSQFSNGISIQVYEHSKLPLVDVLWVRPIESLDAKEQASGVGKLLSLVWGRSMRAELDQRGASLDVDVSADSIRVGVSGFSKDQDWLEERLLSLLNSLTLDQKELEHLKALHLDRLEQVMAQPETLAELMLGQVLLRGSPYEPGTRLDRVQWSALTEKDLQDFFQKQVRPEGSILLLNGRAGGLKRESAFREWKRPAVLAPAASPSPRPDHKQTASWTIVNFPRSEQAVVRLGVALPALGQKLSDADLAPLAVFNTVLGGFFASRLNRVLRDQQGLTYGVSSSLTYSRHSSEFQVRASTQVAQVGNLMDRLSSMIGNAVETGLSSDELEVAVGYLNGSMSVDLSTIEVIATRRVGDRLLGLPDGFLDSTPARLKAVTLDGARDTVKRLIGSTPLSVVVVGDAAIIKKVLTPPKGVKWTVLTPQEVVHRPSK